MTRHESDVAPFRRAARRGNEHDTRVVTMLQELAPHLDGEPDHEFRLATRQRLVAMAAVRTPEPVRPPPLRRLLAARAVDAPAGRWRTRATAGLAGAALTVTSVATLVALSTGAGPGDVLYGVKRGTEQTQLALAGDSRGQALLYLASRRLDELAGLDGDAALTRSTLAAMDDQTSEGAAWYLERAVDDADTAPLDRLSAWTADQSAQLEAVRGEVPPAAAADVAASQGLLAEIAERIDDVREALDCPAGPDVAGTDRLGPVPAGCVPATAGPSAVPDGTPPVTVTITPPIGPTVEGPVPGPLPSPAPDIASVPVPPGGGTDVPQPDTGLPLPNLVPPSSLLPPSGLLPPSSLAPAPDLAAPSTDPEPLIDAPETLLPLEGCLLEVLQLEDC